MQEGEQKDLEKEFSNIFGGSVSATGEEELLRIASKFSRQLSSPQIRALLLLEWIAPELPEPKKTQITNFVERWLELKQYNHSDVFVMKALEFISLRKFISENTFKINLEK